MANILANQTPATYIRTSGVFTADGTLTVPALFGIQNIIYRETAGLALPSRNLNLGITSGGNEVLNAASVTASVLVSSSPSSGNAAFSATADTTIYVTAGTKTITGITRANPAVVTYSGGDTFTNGMTVHIASVVGMVEVNDLNFAVANVNTGANTFELQGIDSTAYTAYSSGGTIGGWNGASITVTLQMAQFD